MTMCFVVLHFMNIQETAECVESIKNLSYKEKQIIIVDNGSGNGTGEILQQKYCTCDNVRVIISEDNLGFAGGNNLGIDSIQNKNNKLIVVCNNDLLFKDRLFGEKIAKLYGSHQYAVCGPNIISEDGRKHECPSRVEICGRGLEREISKYRFLQALISVDCIFFSRCVHKLFAQTRMTYSWRNEMDNINIPIKVHGSCFVLSPLFFKEYQRLFAGTFLFQEENILGDMCRRKNLKILYSPVPEVVHLGSKSYKTKYPDINRRYCDYINHSLDSLKAYKKYLERGVLVKLDEKP